VTGRICAAKKRAALLAAAAVATAAVATGAARAAEVCARNAEIPALETRVLQTELMVAALTCDARASYNAFVTRHRNELIGQGRALRAFFKRAYGKRAQTTLDSFITRLANEASLRTLAARDGYCKDARAVFERVLNGTPSGQLAAMAAEEINADSHGIRACASESQQASTPTVEAR
jgi:hypothetical protein